MPSSVTVVHVVAAYLEWAEVNLHPTHRFHSKVVVGFLIELHGHTPIEKFGPKSQWAWKVCAETEIVVSF